MKRKKKMNIYKINKSLCSKILRIIVMLSLVKERLAILHRMSYLKALFITLSIRGVMLNSWMKMKR